MMCILLFLCDRNATDGRPVGRFKKGNMPPQQVRQVVHKDLRGGCDGLCTADEANTWWTTCRKTSIFEKSNRFCRFLTFLD